MLTKKQFQTKYSLTKREADKICEYYGIKKEKRQFSYVAKNEQMGLFE